MPQRKTNLDEALTLAEKAKGLAPRDGNVLDTLGLVYYLKQMYDQAISALESAKLSLPDNPIVRYHLGMAYYKRGLKDRAITELSRAIEIDNKFPMANEAQKVLRELRG